MIITIKQGDPCPLKYLECCEDCWAKHFHVDVYGSTCNAASDATITVEVDKQ